MEAALERAKGWAFADASGDAYQSLSAFMLGNSATITVCGGGSSTGQSASITSARVPLTR
jgi:hypothetical protein